MIFILEGRGKYLDILEIKWETIGQKFYTGDLHSLYPSPNTTRKLIKSWRMKWAGYEICKGEIRNACPICVGKYQGREQSEGISIRLEDNFKTYLREIRCELK
jgi:hypothetical protein